MYNVHSHGLRLLVLVLLLMSSVRFFHYVSENPLVSLTLKADSEVVAAREHFVPGDIEETRPRNLRITFIGDSLTRFQYISLVYFLKYGRWIDDRETPGLLNRLYFNDWASWVNYSSFVLQPQEHCDCYRKGYLNASVDWRITTNENRFYRDDRGNHVTLLVKFGKYPLNGHWRPKEVFSGPMMLGDDFIPYNFHYNWSETIRDFVGQLDPRPDYIVFNAGLHPHDLAEKEVQQSIVQALNDTGINGIYKTTTLPRKSKRSIKKFLNSDHAKHDAEMCRLVGHCFNLSWTFSIRRKHYLDNSHYTSEVNTIMNKQLLRYLQDFDPAGDRSSSPVNITALL